MKHKAARPDPAEVLGEHPFAPYVRTLGRGPGRSRALTREEARTALGMALRGQADPHQIGAFLMLLRYRGEDPDEMAGLVEAVRETIGAPLPCPAPVDLDWPSYGSGRTRGAPWYLLAALALSRAGHRVLMHGSNEFTRGTTAGDGLAALGMHPARDPAEAAAMVARTGFAYLPLAALSPALDAMLGLRHLLGLRSPLNTAARLLNPFDAAAGVDGVFHPPYVELHLAAAERLGRTRLAVVKGGGGEAERGPAKAVAAHLFDRAEGRAELLLPPLGPAAGAADLARVWRGDDEDAAPGEVATVRGTIALGLLALGVARTAEEADGRAAEVWAGRHAMAGAP